MFNRFNNIRMSYVRSHISAFLLTFITLTSILLSIYVLFEPNWLQVSAIIFFLISYGIIGLLLSIYTGFKSSSRMKERFDYLSLLIKQFANGHYKARLQVNDMYEISRISNELNELGDKLQNQVVSLQRLADEKSSFAKSAYKAAVIEERQRLARELHDSVSQQLFALTMLSEAALRQIDENPALAKKQLQEVTDTGLMAQSEMRALLLHLRPVYLSGDTLTEGIEKLIAELKAKTTIQFQLTMEQDLSLPASTEEHIFRIIQEALANILRHAQATKVSLSIKSQKYDLYIDIRDDGVGFDLNEKNQQKTSYGLNTMKERCEELGGTFVIRSNKGEGTYITMRIPYRTS